MTTEHKDDGGPAFPHTVQMEGFDRVWVSGMSLRDWFAGQALAAIVRDRDALHALNGEPDFPLQQNVTVAAYQIADAMLRARKP
jgi:hypothetical protein